MPEASSPIAVVGAGSWGTALALVLARNGLSVRLWGHAPAHLAALVKDRENRRYLPGFPFPETLSPTDDLAMAVDGVRDCLVVTPSHAFRRTVEELSAVLPADARLAWATKGLDTTSGGLLHQVAERILPGRPLAVLSGPSFAREVAAGLPTAVTLAATDLDFANELAAAFHNETFRPYTSGDIIGVELGGAVKNVLAVATGIGDGLGLGANTRAGLITRGLAELVRLGLALGAEQRTFMGLSGVGDLILTCTDNQSRNRRLGLGLGEGRSLDTVVAEIGQTVESVRTAREVRELSGRVGVEMPICDQVYEVVVNGVAPKQALNNLMGRERKAEFGE